MPATPDRTAATMTTETTRSSRISGVPTLISAGVISVAIGAAIALLGLIVSGSPAALGAAVGTVIVIVVFLAGSLLVDLTARVMPAASLLIALLTYTLQVAAVGLIFAALDRSGTLDDHFSRPWVAAGVIAAALVWMVAQIVLTTRRRIPVYELADEPGEANAR